MAATDFLSRTEPVRRYLYSLLGPLLAVLVVYGIVGPTLVPLFIALGAAVLAIPTVEAARSRVRSKASLEAEARAQAEAASARDPFDYPEDQGLYPED
jgi:hypothetical protein